MSRTLIAFCLLVTLGCVATSPETRSGSPSSVRLPLMR